MEKLVDTIIKINLDEIETFDFPLDEPFGLEINYNTAKFCFIIRFSSTNKNLICCGSGAQQRDRKTSDGTIRKPPYLDRWSWFKYFEESFLVYADPIFFKDEHIRLGWYVGDKHDWYIEIISYIIKKLAINQNIFANNIMCYGSSGGGFASICLGTLIRGSKVLVNNSQFTILNYYESFVKDLFRILKEEYSNLNESEIIHEVNYRINTIELFKKEKYIPPITYYVNTESDGDMNRHCMPFIDSLKNVPCFDNKVIIHFYKEKKENVHMPLPINESVALIKTFSKQNLYNAINE